MLEPRRAQPDFIETRAADGHWDVLITETQKVEARLHVVPREMLAGLFAQHNASAIAPGHEIAIGPSTRHVATPAFPAFGTDGEGAKFGGLGFGLALTIDGHAKAAVNQTILSSVATAHGSGVSLVVGPAAGGMVTLTLTDGKAAFNISTDAACSAALGAPGRHFFGAVADGGPRIASLMVDGVLCDVRHDPRPPTLASTLASTLAPIRSW